MVFPHDKARSDMPRTKSETATTEIVKVPEAATPENVARALFEALEARNLEPFGELVHPDAVDDFVALGEFRGRDQIAGLFSEIFTAFPDFDLRVERIIADDTTAVVEWRAEGTFTGGQFQGIEPTGKHVDLRGVDVMEVKDGLLRHNTIYYDGATFARSIGLLPKRDSGMDHAMLTTFNAVTKLSARLRRSN
jgi:steroid delta-isomerase-like uncharacterized protein